MNVLGYGVATCVPLGIACLFMGWNGVVYHGLNALFLQKVLQLVTTFAQYGEYVVYVFGIGQLLGQFNERIIDVVVIVGS